MENINSIRDALNDSKGTWPEVCENTGLDYSWLTKFAQGRIPNPGYAKVQQLKKYLSEKVGAGETAKEAA